MQRYSTDEAASSSSNPPILQPYLPRKKCEICKIIIHNEVQLQSHLRGRKHKDQLKVNEGRKLSGEEIQTCNLKYIVDAADNEQDPKILLSKERIKAMKKRSKKIKTRMSSRAAEFEASLGQPNAKIIEAPNKAKIGKSIREMDKLLGSQGKGSWPDSSVATLERSLGEISRSLDKNEAKDKHAFFALKGNFDTFSDFRDFYVFCFLDISNFLFIFISFGQFLCLCCLHFLNTNRLFCRYFVEFHQYFVYLANF